MSITDKFGSAVGNMSLENSEKARKLLLTGYRLQEKRLLIFPDRGLPASGQYAARLVMQRIIQALEKPERAAMVSIFVPGELLTAAGLTPYSVEALSCFMAGTKCEQIFLRKTEEEGFPETMCSYHRVFLGAALTGLLPKPKCMVYTNLACDGNMMTFPYLKETYDIPGFYIDVPYEKNKDSVVYVAEQLREQGVTSALLNLGGNVQTVGGKPDGSPWSVGVQDPASEQVDNLLAIQVVDQAVVTSGSYQRYFQQDGQTYWHILDPETAAPARTGLASVTVVGPDGTVCDGLATALFVLGEEAGIELWRAHPELGVQVIWVREDGSVALTEGLEENYQVNPQHRGLDMTVVEA